MQRFAPAIASVVFGALAVAALSACGADINGAGVATPVGQHGNNQVSGPVGSVTTTTDQPDSPTGSAPTSHAPQGNTGSTSGTGSTVTASAKCVISDYEDLPGMPHTPLYQPRLTWLVTHATGMALSVDNPGLVGSYGTYGAQGSLLLGGGCYQDEGGSTTITFYSVGTAGPRVHRTIVLTPTMTRPTPPPFATGTTTTAPTP
ncbi:MAG TPA: hypothetical protein VHW44_27065 [Pseudonocardiaceae bacterium]|jgi:hypothetical protein|nr:hypothetical protein [Pseudonocardiaceae bacterium]